jgi:predicted acyltransferase
VCLAVGWGLSGGGGWIAGAQFPVAVPMIKKLWTSSFAIFAAGWTCWMLAAFYLIIDAAEWKLWAFPFVVVGMNSIAMYVLSQMFRGAARQVVNIFLPVSPRVSEPNPGTRVIDYLPWIDLSNLTWHVGVDVRGMKLLDVVASLLTLLILWLVVFWLYRRKIFFKL